MSEFGDAVRRYRMALGMSQRQLAHLIGLDSTQLNKVERGHRPAPTARYVAALVPALRLTPQEAEGLATLAGLSPMALDPARLDESSESDGPRGRGVPPPDGQESAPKETTGRTRRRKTFRLGAGFRLTESSRTEVIRELIREAEEVSRRVESIRARLEEVVQSEEAGT